MKAYPQELRDRVLEAQDTGESSIAVAERLRVSPAWVRRVWQRHREGGETTVRASGGPRHVKLDRDLLARLQAERPDATIAAVQATLAERFDVHVATGTICEALKKLRLSFKKSRWSPTSGTGPTYNAAAATTDAGSRTSTRSG